MFTFFWFWLFELRPGDQRVLLEAGDVVGGDLRLLLEAAGGVAGDCGPRGSHHRGQEVPYFTPSGEVGGFTCMAAPADEGAYRVSPCVFVRSREKPAVAVGEFCAGPGRAPGGGVLVQVGDGHGDEDDRIFDGRALALVRVFVEVADHSH